MTPLHRRLSQLPAAELKAYMEHGEALWAIIRRAETGEGAGRQYRLGPGRTRRITGLSERPAARLRCFVEVHGPPSMLLGEKINVSDRDDIFPVDPMVLYEHGWGEWSADARASRSGAVWDALGLGAPPAPAEPPSAFSGPPEGSKGEKPPRVYQRDRPPTGTIHLVIGDSHAKPGEDRWRFAALGRMIRSVSEEADDLHVIEIGDWYDMPSLSHYDRGRSGAEGQRVLRDIQAGTDALHTLLDATGGAAFSGHRTQGNHGNRAMRYMDEHPELIGVLDRYDHAFSDAGWEVVPFLDVLHLDGIDYAHYFHGRSGRAYAAKHLAAQLLRERHRSSVVGHSHRLDVAVDPRAGLLAVSVGCWTDEDKSYAMQSNDEFWRGICVLRSVRDGWADFEFFSLDRIRHHWG